MNMLGRTFIAAHVGLYRATGGKIGGRMFGQGVLLLTTTGNKSGQKRTVPVMYYEEDGRRFVIASNNGAPQHPAWFKNLEAKPEATLQVAGRVYAARPEILSGEERARVYRNVVAAMPRFGQYEKKAAPREIPIVELKETAAT